MQELAEFIQSIYRLPKEVLDDFLSLIKIQELPKNYFLLKEGQLGNKGWLVLSGLVRHYYVDEKGKERNTWFSAERTVTGDLPSIVFNEPSKEYIQLMEDSIIGEITLDDFVGLQKKHHEFCLWYIRVLEQFHLSQAEYRNQQLQFFDAGTRYKMLLEKHPDFLQRLSLGNIASYLNISQETLSRIRGSKN